MKPRRWKLRLTLPQIDGVAAQVFEPHRDWTADGFRLCASSGLWRNKHGLYTARLVYRNDSARDAAAESVVVTIRNIEAAHD
jgi:hypothetical protein